MKLGFNSVLFGGYPMETAFQYAALCGYDGIEVSAISGMSEHLVLGAVARDCAGDQAPRPGVRPRVAGDGAAFA